MQTSNERARRVYDIADANTTAFHPRPTASRSTILALALSTQQPVVAESSEAARSRSDSSRLLSWFVWVAVLAAAVLAGIVIGLIVTRHGATPSSSVVRGAAQATWAAGAKRAPEFTLIDQSGHPVSIARFRGRPVIVTFIDPLCRNLCPLEAKVIDSVEATLQASDRPAVVAVSVDQWGDARRYLLEDDAKWKLGRDWHWAVGKPSALRRVWRAFEIAVLDAKKTVAGVTVHNVVHTEAAFLIDRHGYQRALYLFPFDAADVATTVRQLARAQS
jgi:cytochrome oxidase Cu insertion factor (SCO1/SenC/PrrC family)